MRKVTWLGPGEDMQRKVEGEQSRGCLKDMVCPAATPEVKLCTQQAWDGTLEELEERRKATAEMVVRR